MTERKTWAYEASQPMHSLKTRCILLIALIEVSPRATYIKLLWQQQQMTFL